MGQRHILHCDCNCFYASVEMQEHPELRRKSIAVCGDPEARHGIVLTASYPAKRMGVKTGMPIWEAKQHCRDLIIVPASYGKYQKYSGYVREIFRDYTDQVESFGLDEAWLDITGSVGLFGSPVKIAKEISVRIDRFTFAEITHNTAAHKYDAIIYLDERVTNEEKRANAAAMRKAFDVLTHEYVHIRRFDAITKILFAAVLCIHWFNPLVWVMYVLANRDIELSCDAWVIRMMGEKNRSSYALMLIKMEERRSGMSALYSHFGKNAISERIEAIMKFKKTSILACTLALALIAGATTAFAATNSVATADTSKEKLFGQLSATDDNVKSDGTVAVQKVDQSPFAEVDQESNNSGNDATAEQDGIANFPTQGTKTSIAAKSSIYYNFGTGANNTFYEADTVIEFSIQCVYADIPVQVSLVTADKTEVISSQVVESNEVTPISFTIPEDGDYLICITNESASRTQEYSHMIAR